MIEQDSEPLLSRWLGVCFWRSSQTTSKNSYATIIRTWAVVVCDAKDDCKYSDVEKSPLTGDGTKEMNYSTHVKDDLIYLQSV